MYALDPLLYLANLPFAFGERAEVLTSALLATHVMTDLTHSVHSVLYISIAAKTPAASTDFQYILYLGKLPFAFGTEFESAREPR